MTHDLLEIEGLLAGSRGWKEKYIYMQLLNNDQHFSAQIKESLEGLNIMQNVYLHLLFALK